MLLALSPTHMVSALFKAAEAGDLDSVKEALNEQHVDLEIKGSPFFSIFSHQPNSAELSSLTQIIPERLL